MGILRSYLVTYAVGARGNTVEVSDSVVQLRGLYGGAEVQFTIQALAECGRRGLQRTVMFQTGTHQYWLFNFTKWTILAHAFNVQVVHDNKNLKKSSNRSA